MSGSQHRECPICFKTISSSTRVILECGHRFCHPCAHRWILKEMRLTCPLCRRETNYFFRPTRTQRKALATLTDICTGFMSHGIRQDDLSGDTTLSISQFSDMLQKHVVSKRDEWRRPEMIPLRQTICFLIRHLKTLLVVVLSDNERHDIHPTTKLMYLNALHIMNGVDLD